MKITSLIENTTKRSDMQTEHGLSLYIETDKHKILFDMGQTDLFYQNALKLGIDLAQTDISIISHGHYDHGGGLSTFLKINGKAPVLIHKDAFLPYYNGRKKYIGLDTSLKNERRIIFTQNEYRISPSLTLLTCNERKRKYPVAPSGLNVKIGNDFLHDGFMHEQYLLICEAGKRILISGCSHKGILDITEWLSPDVLIGGFHFSKFPLDKELEATAKRLNACPTSFHTCHCTGNEQYKFMKSHMSRLSYLSCGDSIII